MSPSVNIFVSPKVRETDKSEKNFNFKPSHDD